MKVHIYAQPFHHGDAYIVANAEGLTAIRDACDAALKRGSVAIEPFTEDGEGYALIVMNIETRDPKWSQLHLPYTDNDVIGIPYVGSHPVEILGTLRYRELHARIRASDRPPEKT